MTHLPRSCCCRRANCSRLRMTDAWWLTMASRSGPPPTVPDDVPRPPPRPPLRTGGLGGSEPGAGKPPGPCCCFRCCRASPDVPPDGPRPEVAWRPCTFIASLPAPLPLAPPHPGPVFPSWSPDAATRFPLAPPHPRPACPTGLPPAAPPHPRPPARASGEAAAANSAALDSLSSGLLSGSPLPGPSSSSSPMPGRWFTLPPPPRCCRSPLAAGDGVGVGVILTGRC